MIGTSVTQEDISAPIRMQTIVQNRLTYRQQRLIAAESQGVAENLLQTFRGEFAGHHRQLHLLGLHRSAWKGHNNCVRIPRTC